jgi:hypothetical protein
MARTKKKGKARAKTQNQQTLPQTLSPLLQLPGELRNQIYNCLFASTRLTFGERSTGRITHKTMRPAINSLAILRVCRQINQEARSLWLGETLFSFAHVEDLLDKFSTLPSSTLSQIRNVRTRGRPLILQPTGGHHDVYYKLAWALELLPGMSLDNLTILGSPSGVISYDTLEGLIKHGNGWRELHFITTNSEMLGFAKAPTFIAEPYWRKPQPSTWNDILLRRDGANSGASVTIYRSTQSHSPGTVIDPRTRQIFEQKVPSPKDLETFGVAKDKQLLAEDEIGKKFLVVVKRGHGAKIGEQNTPPYNSMGNTRHGMTWAEIKRQRIDFSIPPIPRDDDDEGDCYFLAEGYKNDEVDDYIGVDDYVWEPFN